MEENDRSLRRRLDILLHTRKVQADGLLVKVLVVLDLQPRILGDRDMVAP